jgi:hypothetical protein
LALSQFELFELEESVYSFCMVTVASVAAFVLAAIAFVKAMTDFAASAGNAYLAWFGQGRLKKAA